VLSERPSRILKVDPASGAVLASTELNAPFKRAYSVIESWWLAYGDGAVWATATVRRGSRTTTAAR